MNKTVGVTIEGVSALLMHAFPLAPIEALEKKLPDEQAEHAAYRDTDSGELYAPGVAIQRSLINGAAYCKGKGRASLQKSAAACLVVSPERVSLGCREYIVDCRPVVVPATKGRVLRYRPRLDKWRLSFQLDYDDALLSAKQVRDVVDNAGTRVGLLDFRPERKGPFGRFIVVEWRS